MAGWNADRTRARPAADRAGLSRRDVANFQSQRMELPRARAPSRQRRLGDGQTGLSLLRPDDCVRALNSDEAVETTPTGQLIAKTLWETKFNNGVFELLHVFSPRLVKRIQVWNRPGFLSQRDGIASAVYLQRFRFQLFVGKDPFRQSFEDQKLPGRHLMVEG